MNGKHSINTQNITKTNENTHTRDKHKIILKIQSTYFQTMERLKSMNTKIQIAARDIMYQKQVNHEITIHNFLFNHGCFLNSAAEIRLSSYWNIRQNKSIKSPSSTYFCFPHFFINLPIFPFSFITCANPLSCSH